jgi:hypothetical protein
MDKFSNHGSTSQQKLSRSGKDRKRKRTPHAIVETWANHVPLKWLSRCVVKSTKLEIADIPLSDGTIHHHRIKNMSED